MTERIIAEEYLPISRQEYGERKLIEGVKIIAIEKDFVGQNGRLTEIVRLDEDGKVLGLPELKVRQTNYVEVVPGARKAWHLHEKQDEAWFVHPKGRLIVGLLDMRKDSDTKGDKMRLILGGGKAHLVFIPKGVAHGCSNPYQETATLNYFVDQHFDGSDEYRKEFDFKVGKDFWEIQAG